jgi:cytochrome c-type biogenesis protein CcmH/NrfG
MPDLLLLLLGLGFAAAIVLAPLWKRDVAPGTDDEREAAELRHRGALEALRDVEADRRSGSLEDAAYAAQLAEAEARAAKTRAGLDAAPRSDPVPVQRPGRRAALIAAGIIGAVLVAGWAVPASGVANRTVTNHALAAAEAAEEARRDRIRELTADLADDPENAETLSDLADAYLAGASAEDLSTAVVVLQALLAVEPERNDAYERTMSAYLRAGDATNARAAHDAYAEREGADPVEVAFLDGLIARAEGDAERAVAAFDRFLELAPNDPRAEMVSGLRDEIEASP